MSRMSLGQLCSLGCLVALHLPRLHCPGFLPRCHFPAFVQLAAPGELHPHLRLGTFARGDPSSQDPFPPVHKPVLVLPGPAQSHLLYKSPSTSRRALPLGCRHLSAASPLRSGLWARFLGRRAGTAQSTEPASCWALPLGCPQPPQTPSVPAGTSWHPSHQPDPTHVSYLSAWHLRQLLS